MTPFSIPKTLPLFFNYFQPCGGFYASDIPNIAGYIGKGYEYEALDTKKSFTSSQIKQIYKLSSKRLAHIMREFGKEAADGDVPPSIVPA